MDKMPWEEEPVDLVKIDGIETSLLDRFNQIHFDSIQVEVDSSTIFEAVEFTKKLKSLIKDVAAAQKAAVDPIRQEVERVAAPYKLFTEKITGLEKKLTTSVNAVLIEQKRAEEARKEKERQERIEAMRIEAEKYAAKGDFENAVAVEDAADMVKDEKLDPVKASVKSVSATASLRKYYMYEITNPDLVPREYCVPSPGQINKAVQDARGAIVIPGCRVWVEERAAYR